LNPCLFQPPRKLSTRKLRSLIRVEDIWPDLFKCFIKSRNAETLGHVSIDTTNICAETDLEMKAKALATCEVTETKRTKRGNETKG